MLALQDRLPRGRVKSRNRLALIRPGGVTHSPAQPVVRVMHNRLP